MPQPTIDYYYDDIATIINTWDPMDLIRFNSQEYKYEIDALIECIKPTSAESTIARKLKQVFSDSFGKTCTIGEEEYQETAKKIYDLFSHKE